MPGGRAAYNRQKRLKELREHKGEDLKKQEIDEIQRQLDTFKTKLEHFASKHRAEVKKNDAFRQDFQLMCTRIGVDPLASNKGFWAQLLGVGDFYFEVAVQITDVCMATRQENGGIIELHDLVNRVRRRRGKAVQKVSKDDVVRAVGKLNKLGSGYQLRTLGGQTVVQSVPMEMNSDQTDVLALASKSSGHVNEGLICSELGWTNTRAKAVLQQLVQQGVAWIDKQCRPFEYWLPGMMTTET